MEFPWTANAGHGYLRARCSSIDLPSNGNFVRKIKRAGSPIFRKLISRLSNVKKSRQASNKTKSRASLRGCGRWNKTKMEENARKYRNQWTAAILLEFLGQECRMLEILVADRRWYFGWKLIHLIFHGYNALGLRYQQRRTKLLKYAWDERWKAAD